MSSRRYSEWEDEPQVLPEYGEYCFYRDAKHGDTLVLVDDEGRDYHFVNPTGFDKYAQSSVFAFWFDQHAPTRVLVLERRDHNDSALEEATGWLESHMPGHFYDDEYMKQRYKEAQEELGPDASEEELSEHAEMDLMYTESGYLGSDEWGLDEEWRGPLFDAAMYAGKALQAAESKNYDMIPLRPLGKGEGERVELEEADILKMYADADLGLTSADVQKISALEEEQTVDLKGFKLERVG